MRNLICLASLAGLLSMAGLLSAEPFFQEKDQRRIVKPGPIVVMANSFKMKVQTQAKFPNAQRPEASIPTENKSLSVMIQPEKKSFAGNGPLAFLVTFENKSNKSMMLFGLEHLGESPKLVIANLDNTNQWSLTGEFAQDKNPPAIELEPGKSKTYTLVVEGKPVILPRPIPLPGPIPLPRPVPFPQPLKEDAVNPGQPAVRKVPPKILPPQRPPVVIGPTLPCGEGQCRARLLMEFQTDPIRRYQHPTWTGKIATNTVDFEIGKPEPIPVPPVVGGPITKERAIELAQTAAERALDSNYRPVPGIKPAHRGEWIANAEKTATITEKKTGGWTIAWTDFPKKGFSYNVKIDVNTNGSAVIREVFTSYSE
ncbi:MAG: hypothetical protein KDA84_29855 [Planctomycetaceae bacterium]|nr:hypothetical protein [Planctomycetaceae bacterium]